MTFVICKYLIKYCITVLKSSRMDRYYQDTGLEEREILHQQTIGIGYTRDNNIGTINQFFHGVNNLKADILEFGVMFNNLLRLIFVAFQTNDELLILVGRKKAI